jgi:asparagine synthase (glutamine-hydrolysing)
MCGIAGYTGFRDERLLQAMTTSLRHRGPDSFGYLLHEDVGLGHARLSIIDVEGGQQPIENEDGSLAVIQNGEFYNFRELRSELQSRGHRFRTNSDAEVILHLYEEMGPRCVERLVGMFAVVIYDKLKRQLYIARDRVGIKPLYYVEMAGKFLFASESKALLRCDEVGTTLDHRAIHDYLALRYVPGPGGMFREIRKFPAGHYGLVRNGKLALERYWRAELFAGPFPGSDDDYLEGFSERFETSIRRRLVSEVPLGAYLSGGLDSSTIVAAMANLVTEPIRTFTVGFDYEQDELRQAAETARLLGCRHTEVACRPSDIELLPKIAWHLDEPLGDPIVIPMYQLAREAKKSVTVVLSGEGADEILGGYVFHKALVRGNQLAMALPSWFRRTILPGLMSLVPASAYNLAFDYPAALGKRGKQKVVDFAPLTGLFNLPEAYRHLISLFDARDTSSLYSRDFVAALRNAEGVPPRTRDLDPKVPFLNHVLHLQFEHWLADDILTKQDKMSMAHGIEARVPFLDHELVEYVLRVPPRLKIDGGRTKLLLRRYAAGLLPPAVVNRGKMPFYVPLEGYLREPGFQRMIADTLSDEAVRNRGLFRPEAIRALRQSMHAGEFVYLKQAFSLMMLELWFRMAVDRRGLE